MFKNLLLTSLICFCATPAVFASPVNSPVIMKAYFQGPIDPQTGLKLSPQQQVATSQPIFSSNCRLLDVVTLNFGTDCLGKTKEAVRVVDARFNSNEINVISLTASAPSNDGATLFYNIKFTSHELALNFLNRILSGQTRSIFIPFTSPLSRLTQLDANDVKIAFARNKPKTTLSPEADNNGLLLNLEYQEAFNHCASKGSHMPSTRELAQFAVARGASGIKSIAQLRNLKAANDAGYNLIDARNSDGTTDQFYFNNNGYAPKAKETVGDIFWSSSKSLSDSNYAFFFMTNNNGLSGHSSRTTQKLSVVCIPGN